MKNLYAEAIQKNEVISFFRGKGEYLDFDRDFGGHNKAFTVSHIFAYRLSENEQVLFERIESDLMQFLNLDDFNYSDLILVLTILWKYFIMKHDENKLSTKWEISNELKITIRKRCLDICKSGYETTNVNRILLSLKERFNFDL